MSQDDVLAIAADMGEQLRELRLKRFGENSQKGMADRLGVARSTYQRMEQGDPTVSIGRYLAAAEILGCLDNFKDLFTDPVKGTGLRGRK